MSKIFAYTLHFKSCLYLTKSTSNVAWNVIEDENAIYRAPKWSSFPPKVCFSLLLKHFKINYKKCLDYVKIVMLDIFFLFLLTLNFSLAHRVLSAAQIVPKCITCALLSWNVLINNIDVKINKIENELILLLINLMVPYLEH